MIKLKIKSSEFAYTLIDKILLEIGYFITIFCNLRRFLCRNFLILNKTRLTLRDYYLLLQKLYLILNELHEATEPLLLSDEFRVYQQGGAFSKGVQLGYRKSHAFYLYLIKIQLKKKTAILIEAPKNKKVLLSEFQYMKFYTLSYVLLH